MRHPDLIVIREAEGHAGPDVFLILDHAVEFAADIADGLLHLQKKGFQLIF